ncbi:MerR family transcriptional regulator [Roseovarius sp. M141]|uniref:MerR family transcriptional regulator n=1 Tax=Roseovarius sp. M141 TaxID=2583806 RepID=UPI0020CD3D93|nr:MerR family transcriptional regulator [Roseovarius sp. M141]
MSKSADAFRTISEVADWLGVPAHVLRFWESKFTQVKPVKRAGGRRYYRPADMQLLGGIRKLLHDEGMTIKGVQKVMREHGVRHVAAMSPPLDDDIKETIAGIALNVPEVEEARGAVLSFDRSRGGAQASVPADDATPKDVQKPVPNADTPPASPDTAPEATTAADTPAERQDEQAPDSTAATTVQPEPADTEDTTAPAQADLPRPPAPSASADPSSAAEDAVEIASPPSQDDAPTLQDSDAATTVPPSPRVAEVSVPEDLDDNVPAAASALTNFGTPDPAILVAQHPALSDLAGRMADLRARMAGGAESS